MALEGKSLLHWASLDRFRASGMMQMLSHRRGLHTGYIIVQFGGFGKWGQLKREELEWGHAMVVLSDNSTRSKVTRPPLLQCRWPVLSLGRGFRAVPLDANGWAEPRTGLKRSTHLRNWMPCVSTRPARGRRGRSPACMVRIHAWYGIKT